MVHFSVHYRKKYTGKLNPKKSKLEYLPLVLEICHLLYILLSLLLRHQSYLIVFMGNTTILSDNAPLNEEIKD
jgi:hypothetical protein